MFGDAFTRYRFGLSDRTDHHNKITYMDLKYSNSSSSDSSFTRSFLIDSSKELLGLLADPSSAVETLAWGHMSITNTFLSG